MGLPTLKRVYHLIETIHVKKQTSEKYFKVTFIENLSILLLNIYSMIQQKLKIVLTTSKNLSWKGSSIEPWHVCP